MSLFLNERSSVLIGEIAGVTVDRLDMIVKGWIRDDLPRGGDFIINVNAGRIFRSSDFSISEKLDVPKNIDLTRRGFEVKFKLTDDVGRIDHVGIYYSVKANRHGEMLKMPNQILDRIVKTIIEQEEEESHTLFREGGVELRSYAVPIGASGIYAYCIDEPSGANAAINSGILAVSGWAIGINEGGDICLGVRRTSNQIRLYRFNKRRPDVVAAYRDKLVDMVDDRAYGFSIRIPIREELDVGFMVGGNFIKILDVKRA